MSSNQTSAGIRTAAELRRVFLEFFERRGHRIMPSSPLVPIGDPTLLFNTAGMVQFKPYYSASGDVPYTRAASVQKCLRLTDLERVGSTPRIDCSSGCSATLLRCAEGRLFQGRGDRLRPGVRHQVLACRASGSMSQTRGEG